MNETQRLKELRTALHAALTRAVEAEGYLEDAAELAGMNELAPEKAEEIWQLKAELDRLGCRILQAS